MVCLATLSASGLYSVYDTDKSTWIYSVGRMTRDRGENEVLRVKPCHSAISCTTKPIWTAPGLRDRKPASSCLNRLLLTNQIRYCISWDRNNAARRRLQIRFTQWKTSEIIHVFKSFHARPTKFLDSDHRLAFLINHDVSESACFCPQVKRWNQCLGSSLPTLSPEEGKGSSFQNTWRQMDRAQTGRKTDTTPLTIRWRHDQLYETTQIFVWSGTSHNEDDTTTICLQQGDAIRWRLSTLCCLSFSRIT